MTTELCATKDSVPTMSRQDAETWLFREARLIDEQRLHDWLALFADDGLYWAPIDDRQAPGTTVALIHDTPLRRRERIYRLLETQAHAQDPLSRTQHIVANVEVEPAGDGEIRVFSSQVIYEIRAGMADYRQLGLGEQRSFAARCEHRLRWRDGQWKIALKKILLLNRDVAIENLTFIL